MKMSRAALLLAVCLGFPLTSPAAKLYPDFLGTWQGNR